jgi:phospholipase C
MQDTTMANHNRETRLQGPEWLLRFIRFLLRLYNSLKRRLPWRRKRRYVIEHVIVLMLENRSFDHLLGYLPHTDRLTGDEFNPVEPSNPNSERVYVNDNAGYITELDPAHDFVNVNRQMLGDPGPVSYPMPMNGFVKDYIAKAAGDVETGKKIMECFEPDQLPALRTLAQEFCLCNRWFSSVPGPTWPNRLYVHAATSDGQVTNNVTHIYAMDTIYDRLAASGLSWNVYYADIPQSLSLQRLWDDLDHFRRFERFHDDVENGELANYTFIEPRYFDLLEWKANDQHPPHDVRLGEYLIVEIYDAIRQSKFWEKSLLIVLYDEHGGFFDHVSPPGAAPNPDGRASDDPPFDFARLGVRVPAILVSPLVERGRVDSTLYEHASLPATIKNLFRLPKHLTARDAAAGTFETNLSRRTPRTDTPLTLPVPGELEDIRYHRELMRSGIPGERIRDEAAQGEISQEPLSEFQEALVELADRLNAELAPQAQPRSYQVRTEYEAAVYIQECLARFLKR